MAHAKEYLTKAFV